ncbi:hypothetical protein IGI37_001188 [Enterococcus sp. AZ194]|uniref:GW dipeptide domain-containing protein n=1 Tax=Enterococcus sp. AZ194 TaxID=2774629 RepID=UPI003F1FBB43
MKLKSKLRSSLLVGGVSLISLFFGQTVSANSIETDVQSNSIGYGTIAERIEEQNSVMGSSLDPYKVLGRGKMAQSLGANDTSLPSKDFIDVSSWNGEISVDQYKKMKSYGVRGVVVKFSEGTTYQSPKRGTQVKNAQSAGLTVSAYHYSHFASEAAAKKEANHFANTLDSVGVAKNIVVVNDAEDNSMVAGNVTKNSVAFANTLKARGYSNVIHYSMASWITGVNPKLNPSTLGKANIWVAQYPYKPSKDKLMHTGYAAWQWASDMTFPNVNTAIGGQFDINMDYLGRFTNNKYDSISKETKTSFKAKIKEIEISDKHGLWDGLYNTREGIRYLGKGSKFAGKTVTIETVATTNRSTYWKFKVAGQVYWLDVAAFTPALNTITKSESVNYKIVIKSKNESSKQGIWTAPYNTTVSNKNLGNGGSYAGQNVRVSRIVTLNTGITYYEFKVNGKVIGWLDKKAFYEPTIEEVVTSYRAKINNDAKKQGIWSSPYNTQPGIKGYGKGSQYVGRTVSITRKVKTTRSTYLETTLNGKKVWMDQKAFTPILYTIDKSEKVAYQVVLRPKNESSKQGLWTAPWNTTIDGRYLGNGGAYAGKTVQISRIVTLNTGTVYYEFVVNGKVIGWLDKKAFYEPKVSETNVKYDVEVVAAAKNQGVWSAPYNTEANIKSYGKGQQYIGKRGTVDKIVKTTRSTYWRVTIQGEVFWLDSISFKQVTKKSMTSKSIEETITNTSDSSEISSEYRSETNFSTSLEESTEQSTDSQETSIDSSSEETIEETTASTSDTFVEASSEVEKLDELSLD